MSGRTMSDSSNLVPLADLVQRWLDWDQDPETRAEIIKLRDEKNEIELEKRLRKRIEFGTAGLRGRMQAGFSSMNALTVIQASQGLAKFIKKTFQHEPEQQQPSVIIGRDARHNSQKFAALAANAFAAEKIRVLWYQSAGPTPLVPFGVLKHRASAGVMVTASHNPAKDNGMYFSNGCQINSPMDSQIAEQIKQNFEPWSSAWKSTDQNEYLSLDSYKDTADMYCKTVTDFVNSTKLATGPPRPFVYTPLHGVGHTIMSRLCEAAGVADMITVAEQQEPDPDFPTVVFPNPEESGALDLAMKTADAVNRDLIIANDPDADRLAVAEKVSGTWQKLTGDQLGILLASYMLDTMTSKSSLPQQKIAMLTTAVSTSLLHKMGAAESFHTVETLTGFKWLGNVARQLSTAENGSYTVPFAFEEALGYMFPSVCYDKDGLTAAQVFIAADTHWRVNEGLSGPHEKLMKLYEKYGYYENLNSYFVSPDPGTTVKLFEAIRRNKPADRQFPDKIGPLPVIRWRDMTVGFDSGPEREGHVPELPVDGGSQMLTVWSEHGIRFTFRGSGTEPKVKIYIESCASSRSDAVKAVCEVFKAVLENWVRPYAPGVTCAGEMVTSSGHVLKVE
ncbi:hypothetical protein AJ79_01701 [Helicocarpus griseus UAMH5409]|uniref:Phosphoglucomutase n=1 Tax=Helicocarpus griseus UAMH5409 TaxID=1447875 RepID=A0A2B7Y5V9_9EURO|nr:hypothetical protein AJ79_01701 [Helicocarpus griseus UAMH5409]